MKTLHFVKAHRLDQLNDELKAAGIETVSVQGKGSDIWIGVADEAPEGPVEAVVTAHAPQAPQPAPNMRDLWDAFATAIDATNLSAAAKTAFKVDLKKVIKAVAAGHRGDV